jgi:zinc transporter ZupT
VPQELGDFGILIHGGWKKSRALLYNFISALTFLLGGLVAYGASFTFDVTFLLPFAAGNFIYIAAAAGNQTAATEAGLGIRGALSQNRFNGILK